MTDTVRDAVASTSISASRETVWEALTSPRQIREYFLGAEVESTWQVGSPVTFAGEWQGKPYRDHGVVLASEPPRLLRISHFSPLSGKADVPENYHTVEYQVEELGDGVRVTITQGNNKNDAEVTESEKTWQLVLSNLKELLES
ncbi:MAG TPA: SRPBCC domain-containing protein [Sinomonas sp.]|nr:SRPBCC domain-containing protein [Sinomonas sp.]